MSSLSSKLGPPTPPPPPASVFPPFDQTAAGLLKVKEAALPTKLVTLQLKTSCIDLNFPGFRT